MEGMLGPSIIAWCTVKATEFVQMKNQGIFGSQANISKGESLLYISREADGIADSNYLVVTELFGPNGMSLRESGVKSEEFGLGVSDSGDTYGHPHWHKYGR
jgi:hypothetical protein